MKRVLLIVIAALFIQADGHTQSVGPQWTCSLDGILDSTTLCLAAAEPGMRRYITDVVAQSIETTAGLFSLHHGTGLNCATGEVVILIDGVSSTRIAAAGSTDAATRMRFKPALIVPSGKDLCVLGDAANGVTTQITGYLAP